MKSLLVTFLAVCSFTAATAQDSLRIKELELRVKSLEERLAKLESTTGQSAAAEKMRQKARQHARAEQMNFKPEDIDRAEKMYQKASQNLWEDAAVKLLDSVVMQYPQLNRAGCAQLYLAQHAQGAEKERLLKDCIARFSECYYLDGTQVGPQATFQLAVYYRQSHREKDARKLFSQLRKDNPDAVGHNGQLLVNDME